jgi:UDP-2-acetamido-3-amino-2,3-dideoxy-glucuronate N-acetyltransferase
MRNGVFIHPSAEVAAEAVIGAGTKIWQHCTILAGARVGRGCVLGQNVFIEGRCRVGDNVTIKNNVSVWDRVELGDDVFVGPSAVFTNVRWPRSHWPRKDQFEATVVERGATIGANATVVCGVTIGTYAMVGAGSVVTGDVPPFALVFGVPAEHRGWVCQCGEALSDLGEGGRGRCATCGSSYELIADRLHGRELRRHRGGEEDHDVP